MIVGLFSSNTKDGGHTMKLSKDRSNNNWQTHRFLYFQLHRFSGKENQDDKGCNYECSISSLAKMYITWGDPGIGKGCFIVHSLQLNVLMKEFVLIVGTRR